MRDPHMGDGEAFWEWLILHPLIGVLLAIAVFVAASWLWDAITSAHPLGSY